ncbi:MAG TPA: hypothetical protein DCY20_11860, partial [Firmicutes bacterium]|nr:hypothetical protein [Bacillota bacterium]
MNKKNVFKKFIAELESVFITETESEWIEVNLINVNRLDLIVVSEFDGDYLNIIHDRMAKLNNMLVIEEQVYLGFVNFYSVEEAGFLGIYRKVNQLNPEYTFGGLVDSLYSETSGLTNNENGKNRAKIISFYSYKGGVGRSVALIQTAYLLANEGKKVAIIDLDIEAPSYNDIFSESIKTNYGLVEYLYNKIYDIPSKDKSESHLMTKLELNTAGDLYIIPTGEINNKYIKRIEKLKHKSICEQKYILELISNLSEQYNLDYVLIDSRTGLNNWGALSITSIADEVVLCAYPNKENVKGTNLILDLIEDRKKCTVVFSRIDSTKQGQEYAKELFKQVKIDQEFIGINYESSIAVNTNYPFIKKASLFKELCDFILEDEQQQERVLWIRENKDKVELVLDKIKTEQEFNQIFTSNEKKVLESSNGVIVVDSISDVESIYQYQYPGSHFEFINNTIKWSSHRENNNKDIVEILQEIDDRLGQMILDSGKTSMEILREPVDFSTVFNGVNIFKNKLDYSNSYTLGINFDDIIKPLNDELDLDEATLINHPDINKWFIIITEYNKLNPYKQCKLIIENELYHKYKGIFSSISSHLLNISWSIQDEEIISQRIDEVMKSMSYIYLNHSSIESNRVDFLGLAKLLGTESNENLIFSKRIKPHKYSKLLPVWLANRLMDDESLSKKKLLKIIKRAA